MRTTASRCFFVQVVCVLASVGCGPRAVPTANVKETLEARPGLTLGDTSKPTAYHLRVSVDPEAETFEGRVEIAIEIHRATRRLWLHAKDLAIDHASIEVAGKSVSLQSHIDEEYLALDAEMPLPVGQAKLVLSYRGRFGDMTGLFHQETGGAWYAYTDLEAIDARAAFPCYDEPRFKVPWTVEVEVPAGQLAFANSPEVSRHELKSGRVRFSFATTPPLPSYLVAFAAGPFDVLEGTAGSTPLRIIAPRGTAHRGGYVLKHTPTWLAFLEDYLGQKQPFQKLDFVAVPEFNGAMENPGLITFTAGILLVGDSPSPMAARRAAGVTAHELAHLWFGDSLTPRFWDDLWLNEGFATWLSDKVVASFDPDRSLDVLPIADKTAAYELDHRPDARVVRQPIVEPADIHAAFDAITYRKGGAVFSMLEGFLGEERMRMAVRIFLNHRKFATTDASELAEALSKGAPGEPVREILRDFTTQNGIPAVSVRCGASTLRLAQVAHWPLRESPSEIQRAHRWTIPVCMRLGYGQEEEKRCAVLREATAEVTLERGCPAWIQPNHEDRGYYHYSLPLEDWRALAHQDLSEREDVGLFYSLLEAVRRGHLPVRDALDVASSRLEHASFHAHLVLEEFLYELAGMFPEGSAREWLARWVAKHYGPIYGRLGDAPSTDDDEVTRQLRGLLVRLLGDLAADRNVRSAARATVEELLETKNVRISRIDILESHVLIRASEGDPEESRRMFQILSSAESGIVPYLLVLALHSYGDPRTLEATLAQTLEAAEDLSFLPPLMARNAIVPALRAAMLHAADAHASRFVGSDSEEQWGWLDAAARRMCREEDAAVARTLDPALASRVEASIRGCLRYRDALAPQLAR